MPSSQWAFHIKGYTKTGLKASCAVNRNFSSFAEFFNIVINNTRQ